MFCAVAAVAIALPLEATQLVVVVQRGTHVAVDWPQLVIANGVLLAGAAAVAADIPVAGRTARALLTGIGVPLLLPGPTVFDGIVLASGGDAYAALQLLMPYAALLLVLGCAEAWVYLLATRRAPLR